MAEQNLNPDINPDSGDDFQDITLDELLNGDSNLQSQFDKKMESGFAKRLEKEKARWQAEAEAERAEAEKLAKMSEEERNKVQFQKIEDEKNQAVAELNAYRLRGEAEKIAKEKGLDSAFLDYFDFAHETAESVKAKIDNISGFVTSAIEKGINEKLRQDSPKEVRGNSEFKKPFTNASY